jgi:hypothetical protein
LVNYLYIFAETIKTMSKEKKGPGRPEKAKGDRRTIIRVSVLVKHENAAKALLTQVAKPFQL